MIGHEIYVNRMQSASSSGLRRRLERCTPHSKLVLLASRIERFIKILHQNFRLKRTFRQIYAFKYIRNDDIAATSAHICMARIVNGHISSIVMCVIVIDHIYYRLASDSMRVHRAHLRNLRTDAYIMKLAMLSRLPRCGYIRTYSVSYCAVNRPVSFYSEQTRSVHTPCRHDSGFSHACIFVYK